MLTWSEGARAQYTCDAMSVRDWRLDEAIDELDAVDASEHVAVPVLDEVALEEGLYLLV